MSEKRHALVIELDPTNGAMRHRWDGDPIPHNLLVNYLEILKIDLCLQQLNAAKRQDMQSAVVGPAGQIFRSSP